MEKQHSWYPVIHRNCNKKSLEVVVKGWKNKPSLKNFFRKPNQTISVEPQLNK